MQYQTFLIQLQELLNTHFKEQAVISLLPILKNNTTYFDALCINFPKENISPILYVKSYYEKYQAGQSLESILEEIILLCSDYHETPPTALSCLLQFNQFPYAKFRIAYKLINTDMNQSLLKQVPHISFLDLSIVFYLYLDTKDTLPMTALIDNTQQALWNCSTKELYTLAQQNTPRLLPPTFSRLHAILNHLLQSNDLEDFNIPLPSPESALQSPIYILTNYQTYYGASCILYPNILKKFADAVEKDLILIPSSIHEFLILPFEETIPFFEFNDMVASINQSSVSVEDRLSDHIYYYSRETESISIPASTI